MPDAVIAHLAADRDAILERLKALLRIPSVSTDVHAPNEFFRLSSLDEGLRSWPLLLAALGELTAADFAPFRAKQ